MNATRTVFVLEPNVISPKFQQRNSNKNYDQDSRKQKEIWFKGPVLFKNLGNPEFLQSHAYRLEFSLGINIGLSFGPGFLLSLRLSSGLASGLVSG